MLNSRDVQTGLTEFESVVNVFLTFGLQPPKPIAESATARTARRGARAPAVHLADVSGDGISAAPGRHGATRLGAAFFGPNRGWYNGLGTQS